MKTYFLNIFNVRLARLEKYFFFKSYNFQNHLSHRFFSVDNYVPNLKAQCQNLEKMIENSGSKVDKKKYLR